MDFQTIFLALYVCVHFRLIVSLLSRRQFRSVFSKYCSGGTSEQQLDVGGVCYFGKSQFAVFLATAQGLLGTSFRFALAAGFLLYALDLNLFLPKRTTASVLYLAAGAALLAEWALLYYNLV